MRIDELLAGPEPVFSFEFFPPKTEQGEQNLYSALAELRTLEPSYVSVTYGAGGSTRAKTIEIVKRIKDDYGLEAMAHFTCVGATVPELRSTLDHWDTAPEIASLRVQTGIRLMQRMTLLVGAGANVAWGIGGRDADLGLGLPESVSRSGGTTVRVYPGFLVGLQI